MSPRDYWRRGEKYTIMNWCNNLKIALINKDSQRAFELTQNLPHFDDIEDMLEARELIAQVVELLENERDDVKKQMLQIRIAKQFLEI